MRFHKTISATVLVASLGAGALSLAPSAGAQTSTDANGRKEQVCQRAHDEWQELVAANQRAVNEYHRLRALQQRLLANHHDVAAHRLDALLDAARHRHEQVVARSLVIAAKVKAFCTEAPPVLPAP